MSTLPNKTHIQKNNIPARTQVYNHLKSSILSGRLNPAERLTEEYLAEMMGVSRTPVREALYKLESEGFIKPLETRGYIVSGDSKDEVEELFEIRSILEGYKLRIISKRIEEHDLQLLDGFIEKAEKALNDNRMDEVFKWNTRFHDTLHELVSEKRRLFQMIVNIRENVLRYRRNTLKSPDGARRTLDGHRKILLALRLRDPDLCERTMREHIMQAKKDALQTLSGECKA